ncbi:hypothetical protein DPEC_G00017180 [Dallia pectoralis]|uniref:Uncharacterized protein n=1 Tax=Dallia pectoralis TaxID=75939 RepID=A0ACC2HFF8_DALPE|nr:hypothetical protein DPEC_G00017180 [Dallia pectoralis]
MGHNHLYTLVSHRPGPNGEEGPRKGPNPTAPIQYEPQELRTIIKPPTEQVPSPPSHHTTADVPPLGETVRGAGTIAPPAPLSRLPHAQPGTQQRLHEHQTRLPSAVVSRAATVCGTTTDQAVEETVRLVMEQNQEGLTETQQRQLWDVIYEHRAAFATGPTDMGRTHILQHEIDTGISHLIRQRPRRLPLMKQAAADQCLEEMHAAGVVEPSESPWMSPVVLVKKKDGTWRYCVDFRQLNDITVKDSYPLPRVDESLDRIKGSVWFSSLDLRSGYWQVPLSTEARPKTAFSTGSGLWQFTAMPFGLCNAPATFERLMERVLADVPGNNLQVYLDDVLVHGVNFEAALTALQTVLSKIQQAGLKLNPGKCKLMRKELVFLGHKVSGEGVGTEEGKVTAVRDWPTPKNLTELRSFLGLASYYRRFIAGFSTKAAPLNRLTNKNTRFAWGTEQQQAFDTLKTSLCQSPVLTTPEPGGEFVLDTDASNEGLGAVLAQVTAKGERVIAYSRRPCPTECSHCSRAEDRDHEAVKENEAKCRALRLDQPADWATEQQKDQELKDVMEWVGKGQRPEWQEVAVASPGVRGLWAQWDSLSLRDGMLWRRWKEPATGRERWQVVVPQSRRQEVLAHHHGQPGVGHFGVNKTLKRLQQAFYWVTCRREVQVYCQRCDACTARKGPMGRAPLQQYQVGAPMDRVAVDVLGPFPRTPRGNRFVVVAMDYFTKWPEAYAVPDQEAAIVCEVLIEGMFSRFGVPTELHSDQGRNFEAQLFAEMCRQLAIHKTRTTPLRPQSDGLVERFNRTLGAQLALVVAKDQKDWDRQLPLVLLAYRSATQESTGCTPALLMFGRELRTPPALVYGQPPDSPRAVAGPEYAHQLWERLEVAHEFAGRQAVEAGMRQKRAYDQHTKGAHYKGGDLVVTIWFYQLLRYCILIMS